MTITTAFTVALALTAPPAVPEWTEIPTGLPAGIIYSIDANGDAGGDELWAVGVDQVDPTFRPLALRWSGKRWEPTKQPVTDGRLLDIAVRGPRDVWAAGDQDVRVGDDVRGEPLAQHWDGKRWTLVPVPLEPGEQGGLTAVATTARGGTWAGGPAFTEPGDRSAVWRYDPDGWHRIPDSHALGYIWDLLPVAPDDVWVGNNGISHWDGRNWTKVDIPGSVQVMGFAAAGPDDVWAVGLREDPKLWRRPLILHYDGTRWSEAMVPAETAQLNDIQLVRGEPVAVGESGSRPYLLRRTMSGQFAAATTPAGAGGLLSATVAADRLWVGGVDADWNRPYLAAGRRSGRVEDPGAH